MDRLNYFGYIRKVLVKRITLCVASIVLIFNVEKCNVNGKSVNAQENTEVFVENSVQEESESNNDVFFGISLKDIINSAIGAFLGFGVSLILEQMATSANKRKSINNIIAELETVRDGIRESILSIIPADIKSEIKNDRVNKSLEEEKKAVFEKLDKSIREMVYIIYLPIWETVLQTGDILEFKDKPYFETMILIYTKIYRIKALIESYYNVEKNISELTTILKDCLELDVIFTDDKNSIAKLLSTK